MRASCETRMSRYDMMKNRVSGDSLTGMIFDLKRFAVHDGDGLRSTLFLKGCPLRCPWCQNPEGLRAKPLLWYSPSQCLHCGTCVASCPEKALSLSAAGQPEEMRLHIRSGACRMCGRCVELCPGGALEIRGREVGVEEAADMLLRDRVFFREKGGVTLSGGEVLMQWRFAGAVLKRCREAGVDTAVETSLEGTAEALAALMEVTDHFLIDIKIFDPERHKAVIGTDNSRILKNYETLVKCGKDVLVRTPLIPGYTAEDENIRSIARYVRGMDPDARYELLNYNPLCRSKYEALEVPYPVEEKKALSEEEMEHFYRILQEEQIRHIVKE